jgi:hypothetical protein
MSAGVLYVHFGRSPVRQAILGQEKLVAFFPFLVFVLLQRIARFGAAGCAERSRGASLTAGRRMSGNPVMPSGGASFPSTATDQNFVDPGMLHNSE